MKWSYFRTGYYVIAIMVCFGLGMVLSHLLITANRAPGKLFSWQYHVNYFTGTYGRRELLNLYTSLSIGDNKNEVERKFRSIAPTHLELVTRVPRDDGIPSPDWWLVQTTNPLRRVLLKIEFREGQIARMSIEDD